MIAKVKIDTVAKIAVKSLSMSVSMLHASMLCSIPIYISHSRATKATTLSVNASVCVYGPAGAEMLNSTCRLIRYDEPAVDV